MGHDWHPIEPLPADWDSWVDSELAAVRTVWADLQAELGEDAATRLHQRMLTEWSIETGMVEDLYRWDRGVTETLLTHGVRADRIPDGASAWTQELVAQVIHDQIEVVEGLFSFVKSERPLGTSFVHELHAQLLKSTPHEFELGKWKTTSNWVTLPDGSIHEYCQPEHVASEMDRLLELSMEYAAAGVPVEIRAAWLHHRFTEIHPYPDGNGRTARALASLLLIQDGLFPLIIRREEKDSYFEALGMADNRNLRPLIERFRALQRREVVKMSAGMPVSHANTGPAATLEDVLRRVEEKLVLAERMIPEKWSSLPTKINALADEAKQQIDSLAQRLTERLGGSTSYQFASVDKSGETAESLGLRAEHLDYMPRSDRFRKNICLRIAIPHKWHIVAAFHEIAPRTNGLAACVVFLSAPSEPRTLQPPSEYFLLTYAEPLSDCRFRFAKWFDAQLILAIDEWQRRL